MPAITLPTLLAGDVIGALLSNTVAFLSGSAGTTTLKSLFLPDADNSRALGSSAKRFSALFAATMAAGASNGSGSAAITIGGDPANAADYTRSIQGYAAVSPGVNQQTWRIGRAPNFSGTAIGAFLTGDPVGGPVAAAIEFYDTGALNIIGRGNDFPMIVINSSVTYNRAVNPSGQTSPVNRIRLGGSNPLAAITGAVQIDGDTFQSGTFGDVSGTVFAQQQLFTFQDGGVASTTSARGLDLNYTINYTGATRTGTWDAIRVSITETSLPTGALSLIRMQIAGSDKFFVARDGSLTMSSDTRLQRSAANTLAIDNGAGGAATIIGGADNQLAIGTAANRLVSVTALAFQVFAAAGTAQPSTLINNGTISLGIGGATAPDVIFNRSGINTVQMNGVANALLNINFPSGARFQIGGTNVLSLENNNVFNTNDVFSNLGTSSNRWISVVSGPGGHKVFGVASAANPSAALIDQALQLGVGGASPLDVQLKRTAAATLTIDNNAAGPVTASFVGASTITNTAGDMTYGASGNVLLSPGAAGFVKYGYGSTALGAGALAINGSVGGTGPASNAQNAWYKFVDSAGVAFFVPIWR